MRLTQRNLYANFFNVTEKRRELSFYDVFCLSTLWLEDNGMKYERMQMYGWFDLENVAKSRNEREKRIKKEKQLHFRFDENSHCVARVVNIIR